MKTETAIILVNYNTEINMLKDCLNSLNKKKIKDNNKVILVDNNSKNQEKLKKLINEYSFVDFIFNKKNNGFGGGNNIGINYARKRYSPEYFYFLNTDTKVQEDFLEKVIECAKICSFRHKEVGIVGSNQKDFNGNFKSSSGEIKFLRVKYNTNYESNNYVKWVSGAGFLIKEEVFKKIGLFNELYNPAYYEETDLEMRCLNEGYKIIFCSDSIIFHKGGGSTDFNTDYLFYIFHRNRIFYFLKYYSIFYFFPRFIYDFYKALKKKKLKLLFKAYKDGIELGSKNDR